MNLNPRMVRLALTAVVLFCFIFGVMFIGLGKFVTVDEPAWTLFASNFYLALSRRQFEKTAIDYGVTTLWILTLAFLSYFPGYRGVANYTDKYWRVEELFQKYHKLPLTLLVRGRVISIFAIASLLVVLFILLDLLIGMVTALVVLLMIVLDPFFLGNSRLLNHEALMATCILVSIFAVLVYLYKRNRVFYLLLSGAAAGVALLAKVPAIVLFPLVGLMFTVRFLEDRKSNPKRSKTLLRYAGGMAIWVLVVINVYILLWPGMWVDPKAMLYEVFSNALSNALQGGRLASTQALHPESFALDPSGAVPFFKIVFLKTTPIVWFGCILAIAGMWVKKGYPMSSICKRISIYFGLLAILFVFMFGMAQGRNSVHYVLTSFVSLDVVAGIGIAWGYGWLAERALTFRKRAVQVTVLTGVLLLHWVGALPQYPYYYTYANSIAKWLTADDYIPGVGYGEGLEQAATYLAAKPGSEMLTAMSWYGTGPFSYFFPGKTHILKSSDTLIPEEVEELRTSDYLVIYYAQQSRRSPTGRLMLALQGIEPEVSIWINGIEYARIYPVERLPEPFFEQITQ